MNSHNFMTLVAYNKFLKATATTSIHTTVILIGMVINFQRALSMCIHSRIAWVQNYVSFRDGMPVCTESRYVLHARVDRYNVL